MSLKGLPAVKLGQAESTRRHAVHSHVCCLHLTNFISYLFVQVRMLVTNVRGNC